VYALKGTGSLNSAISNVPLLVDMITEVKGNTNRHLSGNLNRIDGCIFEGILDFQDAYILLLRQ